jgi:hypothetical protein
LEYFPLIASLHAQSLTQIFKKLHVQSIQTLKVDGFWFFIHPFFLPNVHLLKIGEDFNIDD